MPANYTLIEKITVGAAGASSVTFSGIPQTGYTDLVVRASARGTLAAVYDTLWIQFNNTTPDYSGTGVSARVLQGSGSAASSSAYAALQTLENGATATASTFGTAEFYIPNYTSSNFKSVSTDAATETNATTAYTNLLAGLWSSTAAITSATLFPSSGNTFVQYSTFYLYGVAKLGTTPAIVPYATGGDIIETDGTYWYHAFLSSGTFTPAKGLSCDVLVVAGGGGGGTGTAGVDVGGGGGAGGALGFASQSLTTTGYTVTIGAGGASNTSGNNSIFGALTTVVGGGNGAGNNSSANGANGGSGGGGRGSGVPTGLTGGTGSQGSNGGSGSSSGSNYGAGAGGGAGGVGANGTSTTGGNGGAGINSITNFSNLSTALSVTGLGVAGYIAGGGGGGTFNGGTVGTATAGGGAAGTSGGGIGTNGTANSGGGGGGGSSNGSSTFAGGTGGSGLVIVRYAV